MEFRLAGQVQRLPDFREGIRAKIVDKDDKPAWLPRTLAGVSGQTVEACFGPLADEELQL